MTAALVTDLWIAGRYVTGEDEAVAVENPATEAVIAHVPQASRAQLDAAVRAARDAFDAGSWANDGAERARVMNRIADGIEQEAERLGRLLVDEVGTPVDLLAPLQVGVPVQLFRYYATLAGQDRTRRLGPDAAGASESIVRQVPVGVVAAIAAYNYPLLLMALKLAPALAAGCAAVVLPSAQTPLATLAMGEVLKRAGVPDGIVSIVVGGVAIGQALSEHPLVDKVTFTGSVAVGAQVMQQAAKGLKGVVLELGGKSAMILMPGFDPAPAIAGCHIRYLRNAGQGCASPTRILVHRPALDRFVALSRDYFATVKVGDPREPGTIVGPLISAGHRARVEAYIERAVAAGATLAAGGGRPGGDGYYLNPTLLVDVENHFEIAREELFAPVGVVIPYDDLDQAVALANDSDLGLAAFVFGPQEEAIAVARRLRAGSVYVNGGGAIRMEAPMGGFKQSGIGREYGEEGLREYLEPQHVQWSLA